MSEKDVLKPKDEHFCSLVASGVELGDAYIATHPAAANWKKISANNKGYDLAKRPKVAARIQELRDALSDKVKKEFVFDTQMAIKILARIAISKTESTTQVIAATKALIELLGLAAPKKVAADITSSDGSMSTKPTIDVTKLSNSALEELLNAKVDV
jgi:phage terminase small subunit